MDEHGSSKFKISGLQHSMFDQHGGGVGIDRPGRRSVVGRRCARKARRIATCGWILEESRWRGKEWWMATDVNGS